MRLLAVGFLAIALGAITLSADAAENPCPTGIARGWATIQTDPNYLVGTIPSRFTSVPKYFSSRFNCRRGNVFVRRVELGVYEVKFPGVQIRAGNNDALSPEGVSSSLELVDDGLVRVYLRGPLAGNDVASRRDVPFTLIVY